MIFLVLQCNPLLAKVEIRWFQTKMKHHKGSEFSYFTGKPAILWPRVEISSKIPLMIACPGGGFPKPQMTSPAEPKELLLSPSKKCVKMKSKGCGNHLTHIHDLRLKHLSLARLAAGSHGDAGCWVPDHTSLDRPVHGIAGSSTGDPHGRTLGCPLPRRHSGPGSTAANHAYRQGREDRDAVTGNIVNMWETRRSYSIRDRQLFSIHS